MKEVIAVLRMDMMTKTKKALSEIDIPSLHASACLGRGKGLVDMMVLKGAEKGYEEAIEQLGSGGRLIPKRLLSIVLPDKKVDQVIKLIIKVNKTGKSGDGKIFVMPIINAHRVRTGESGEEILD
ncbi:MAG: P-II family nitrogen regulator [Desulfobacterales bacterium]|nr:P-II family nitrogen regulator [Desulfobacterales bacterium]MCP4161931.1 P-II family nitrogen regulator [Deltaproteobacteria bacterium]